MVTHFQNLKNTSAVVLWFYKVHYKDKSKILQDPQGQAKEEMTSEGQVKTNREVVEHCRCVVLLTECDGVVDRRCC